MNTQSDAAASTGTPAEVVPLNHDELVIDAVAAIGPRIKTLREEAKLTQQQMAAKIGAHVNTLGKIERGLTVPDLQVILQIAVALKTTLDELLKGDWFRRGSDQEGARLGDLVPISSYHLAAGLAEPFGNGARSDAQFALPQSLLARRGWDARHLVAVSARGDSMTPTVCEGDTLVVDRSENRLSGDGIYLLERDGDVFCKRLQHMFDGGVNVMSDNPRYGLQQIGADVASTLRVIGRVVWIGGER